MSDVSPCGVPGTWLRKELLRNRRLLGLRTGAGIGLTPPIWMGGDCGKVENAAGCAVTFVLQSYDWKMTSYHCSHCRLDH